MRKLALFLLFSSALFAQNPNTAVFPGRVATDSDLFVATNLGSTTLNGSILAGATSMLLNSSVGFVAPVVVSVDSEIFHCTTQTLTLLSGCTPGSEGTVQAAHSGGATVKNIMTAWHHNQMAAEVKAIESNVASSVTGVTNDTNIQGSVAGHTLTFSWAGTLAAIRMANAGVHTGDATGTFPAITLNTVNSNVGTFGDSTHVAQLTVNGKGLITAVSNVAAAAGGNTLTPVTFSATPTFTRTTPNQEWAITLTGNVTSSTLSGAVAGDYLVFNIVQDATGGRTFAWPTGFNEACTINATTNIGTKQTFYWDGTNAHALTPCVTTVSTSDQVLNDAANTGTAAFTLDASASTVANAVKVPVAAGATATANGAVAYDSTNNMLHAAQGAADAKVPQFTVTPTNGDCASWVVSGSNYKLGDTACGGGGTTNTTPFICAGGCAGGYTNTLITVANTMYGWIINIPAPTTIAKVLFNTSGSTNQAWAIYSVNGSSSAKLATSSVGTGCGGCNYAIALSYTFTSPGSYYLCFSSDGNAALTVNSNSFGGPNVGTITPIQVFSVAGAVTWSAGVPTWPSTTGALTSASTGYPYANITY